MNRLRVTWSRLAVTLTVHQEHGDADPTCRRDCYTASIRKASLTFSERDRIDNLHPSANQAARSATIVRRPENRDCAITARAPSAPQPPEAQGARRASRRRA